MSNICESCGWHIMARNWLCEKCLDRMSDGYDLGGADVINEEEYFDEGEDVINEPSHYARWSIEPITYIMRNGMEFWRGNLIKYSSRAGFKIYDGKTQEESEITDLEKVKRYCDMRINQIKGEVEL